MMNAAKQCTLRSPAARRASSRSRSDNAVVASPKIATMNAARSAKLPSAAMGSRAPALFVFRRVRRHDACRGQRRSAEAALHEHLPPFPEEIGKRTVVGNLLSCRPIADLEPNDPEIG